MISTINFTGREEMLTKGINRAKGYGNEILDRYVNEGTILPERDQLMAARAVERATKAPEVVQRHEFLSQTEPVNIKPSVSTEMPNYVADSAPHGIDIIG